MFGIKLLAALVTGAIVGAGIMASGNVRADTPAGVSTSRAEGVSKDDLKALRAEKKELCLKNPECAQGLELKAEKRREKAAAKLQVEIAQLKG